MYDCDFKNNGNIRISISKQISSLACEYYSLSLEIDVSVKFYLILVKRCLLRNQYAVLAIYFLLKYSLAKTFKHLFILSRN